ncbi:DUF6261 family protein [Flavobacterium sp.]
MNLNPISVSQLTYLDSGQFIVRLLTDYSESGLNPVTDPDFKALHDSLIAQSPIYNAALMQIRAKAETEELIVLDRARDRKITTLKRANSVFEFSEETVEITAYREINIVLRTYSDIGSSNYEAESLGVDNLIAALRKPSHFPFVQTLLLEGHVTNLEVANTKFKDKFNERSTEIIETEVYDAKALRKAILETYKDLAEYVFVMAKRKNTPYYIDTLAVVNSGRHYFATIIARQNGGAGGTLPPSV